MNIARDGESVRILGARVGNKVNNNAIWTPTIEKINSSLERWDREHPTLEMCRHIVQMTMGLMTEYLAQVNGKSVENNSSDYNGNLCGVAASLRRSKEKCC
jgi:hypothetical protein